MAELTAPAPAPATNPPRRRVDSEWLRRYGVYLALAVLVAVNVAITPNFVGVASLRLLLVQVARPAMRPSEFEHAQRATCVAAGDLAVNRLLPK